MTKKYSLIAAFVLLLSSCGEKPVEKVTDYVNPFLGTATLWNEEDLGYERTWKVRTWGAETYPGATLPFSMVQLSPVTMYHSGSGYQYEDSTICGFAHTNKGHWNLLHLPFMPACGEFSPDDYASAFSHENESARPGYYQVFLERYGINAEFTTTLRCGFHKYSFPEGSRKQLILDIYNANNKVRSCDVKQCGPNALGGYQFAEGRMCFYAESNYRIESLEKVQGKKHQYYLVTFADGDENQPLELRAGFSFVSEENARENFDAEIRGREFDQIRTDADKTWEELLSRIEIEGGTPRQKNLFYSCLYRTFLWPVLRSDVNGEYLNGKFQVAQSQTSCNYTTPSLWDDYRNKLVMVELLCPEVAGDIISSMTDRGSRTGYMPTFFHGDHSSPFIAGAYLRGVRNFDLDTTYKMLLRNALVPGRGGRPFLDEYLSRGYVAEIDTTWVPFDVHGKAAATKTVEYAYDDYATALLARELGDTLSYNILMEHSQNYKNVFDPSTGFIRGRLASGEWVTPFDPYYPYFEFMYREANAWQSLFFAPHDYKGMIELYPSHEAVEAKLDSLFTEPWRKYEVHNLTGFIGNYCHGNQPGHSIPYTYYFIGRQPKAQKVIDNLLENYYDMGEDKLAYAGMDDAGEMSTWYVFNALGLYTFSPADPEYIVTVPLFDKVRMHLGDGSLFTIVKKGKGLERRIESITCGGRKVEGWFVGHEELKNKTLTIKVD
ncbi:MAG: GH92 family glycosyl hydrolase [Bacteroidales bacterium]|nr:GH92 family glycosyl hydrolase [Bacteroidales bacterium]